MEAGEGEGKDTNYVLIVVGRMGHGKSSFCKMLLSDEEKGKIKVSGSTKSVTLKCQLYKANFNIDVEKGFLIMDTPGLDSKSSIHLIVEDIDDMIMENKLEVIGIAYVMDIHQRDQNQEGKSYIFTFLETLRIKYCHKKVLSFCVLSKFDKHHDSQEENEEIFTQLSERFKEHGYPNTWNNRIPWCSQPCLGITKFETKIKGDCKEIFNRQFEQFKQLLSNTIISKTYLSFEAYVQHQRQFHQKVTKQMLEKYNIFDLTKNKIELKIKVNIQVEESTIPFISSLFKSLWKWRQRIFMSPIHYGIYILLKATMRYQARKQLPVVQQVINKQLDLRMQQKLKICLLNLIDTSTVFQGKKMICKKNQIISEVKCFDTKGKVIEVVNQGNDIHTYFEYGENTVVFCCQPPSNEQWRIFIEEKSREYFNNKQQK